MTFFLLLAASALIFDFSLIGRLTATEGLFLLTLPFLLSKMKCRLRAEKRFYLYAGLWLFGAVITDIVRQTPVSDLLRGWAKISFFILNFTVIRILIGNDLARLRKFILFLFAANALKLALGWSDTGMGLASADLSETAWKFGYGQFFTITILFVSAVFVRKPFLRPLCILAPYGAAGLALWLNARNLTGLTALSAVVFHTVATRKKPLSTKRVVLLCLILGLSGFGILKLYERTASEGLLGEAAQMKYEEQSRNGLGVLAGGRTEIFASTQAILDSPLLGHGSWAHDIKYVKIMIDWMLKEGQAIQGDPFVSDLIPTHSHLFGAWVESGFLGALFWFWTLWQTGKGLLAAIKRPTPYSGVYAFIGLSLIWDIFFSPFGLERRVIIPVWLYLMILIASPEEAPHTREKKSFKIKCRSNEILDRNYLVQSGALSGKDDLLGARPEKR